MRLTIISLIICFFTFCGPGEKKELPLVRTLTKEAPIKFATPEKLLSFVDNRENGFIKAKTIKDITYSAILKPSAYLLAKKIIEEGDTSLKSKDFEDLQYFDLRIKIDEFNQEFIKYQLSSSDQYEERLHYCAFDMQQDLKLLDGKDTLNCVLYHYERAFNIVPYGHFILGFESKKNGTVSTKTLMFNDRLFKNGLIQFTFLPELLVKEPTLL